VGRRAYRTLACVRAAAVRRLQLLSQLALVGIAAAPPPPLGPVMLTPQCERFARTPSSDTALLRVSDRTHHACTAVDETAQDGHVEEAAAALSNLSQEEGDWRCTVCGGGARSSARPILCTSPCG
jgi:hypothetical protein